MRANGVFGLLAAAACGVPIPVIDNRAEEMTGRHATTATSFSITDQSCASCGLPRRCAHRGRQSIGSNDAIAVAPGEVRDRGLRLYLRADRRVT